MLVWAKRSRIETHFWVVREFDRIDLEQDDAGRWSKHESHYDDMKATIKVEETIHMSVIVW